jgi:ATP-dependent protease ClpP protease subunit
MTETILSRATASRVRASAAARTETIYLYDVIDGAGLFSDENGETPKSIAQRLEGLRGIDEVVVRINSPGGDVFQGLAIYNALLRSPVPVTAYVDGMAWSIASVIAMAASRVVLAGNASFMIHNPMAFAFGGAEELRTLADLLDQTKENLINAYQRHSAAGRNRLAAWMDQETWFSAQEAVDEGFGEQVEEALPIAACYPAAMRFRNLPAWVKVSAVKRPQADARRARLAAMNRRLFEQYQKSNKGRYDSLWQQ